MRKKICFVFFLLLIFPLIASAEEYITVTYDANDGSGRTKSYQLLKGDSYTTQGRDIFEVLNDNSNNPMNDKSLYYWNTQPDGNGNNIGLNTTYNSADTGTYYQNVYNLFNNSTNITLYAKWQGRKDVSSSITMIYPTGAAVTTTENGDYIINHDYSFSLDIKIQETSSMQFSTLNYITLPNYFVEYLDNEPDIKASFETKRPFIISITYKGVVYKETSYYYIKNGKLFVDIPIENHYSHSSTNLSITFSYWIQVDSRLVNNRYLVVKELMFNNKEETKEIIYPKGNIVVKYIDSDTNEELDSLSLRDVLGVSYSPNKKIYDGYELILEPIKTTYEYEEYDQLIVYKYRKINGISKEKKENTTKTPNKYLEKNPNTKSTIPLLLVVLFILTGIISITIYQNKHRIIKSIKKDD